MVQMHLGGLGFDPKNMSPIVLLKDTEERNFLPIWIGMFEAAAIAMELQDFKSPRPMTHDLIKILIETLSGHVKRVVISEIIDNTFYAEIEVVKTNELDTPEDKAKQVVIKIDSRPSDAIAIAVRTKSPIFVSEAVMIKAKMVNSEKDEEETQKFKDFIDNINPDDFSKYLDKR